MKTNLLYILVLILVLTTSCKDKVKNEESQDKEASAPVAKQNFSLELDVTVSNKDDFALYYTEDNSINFTTEMAIWMGVQGEGKRETIVFDLSEEKVPTDIRLDFGMNKQQESVTINNVKVAYYGNDFSFKGSDFFKFFLESKDFKTEIDVPNGSLKIMKNGSEYKTPFYYPTEELLVAIKKITTTKK